MESKTEQPAKTAEEIIDKNFRSDYWLDRLMVVSKDANRLVIEAMKEYAAQSYTRTEVSELIKKVLRDAAERAELTSFYSELFETRIIRFDKESIINIDVNQYLSK